MLVYKNVTSSVMNSLSNSTFSRRCVRKSISSRTLLLILYVNGLRIMSRNLLSRWVGEFVPATIDLEAISGGFLIFRYLQDWLSPVL